MKNKLKGLVFILLLCVVPLAHAASISIEAKNTQTFNLNTWLPSAGDTVDLLVSVSGYTHSHGEIQFYFTEVSNWPRTYMNSTDTDTQQDLKIYNKRGKEQSTAVFSSVANARADTALSTADASYLTWETQENGTTRARFSWTSSANMPSTFTIGVTVTCEDYGAFGTLQARLFKASDDATNPMPAVDETATIRIPKDDNANHIADAWEVSSNGWRSGITPRSKVAFDDLQAAVPAAAQKQAGP